MLPSSTVRISVGRNLAAIVAAAIVAAIVVHLDGAPAAPSGGVAGEAMIRLLGDEHAAVAGVVKQQVAARTQADEMAARDFEKMKVAALEEAQATSQRFAQAPVREDKVKPSVVRVMAKSERATTGSAVAGEPMQLLALTETQPVQAPPPSGLVRGRLHQLASTVERIPSWFNAAAGWVVDAVPTPRIPSLPQLPRHFRV